MRTTKRLGLHRGERGSALVMMTMATVALAGLAAALLTVNLGSAKGQRQECEALTARYVCEAGLAQGMYELKSGNSGAVGTEQAPSVWGTSRFWVVATALPDDVTKLRATAEEDRSAACMELTLHEVPNTIWRFAAFGKEGLHMDSNARADSFNSTTGTYESQAVNSVGTNMYASANGDVGSNGDVNMDQNSQVWGDATAGPEHDTYLLGIAEVTGSTTPMDEAMEFPPITVPTYTNFGTLTVTATTTIPASNRTYSNVRVNASKTLNITGPANIVMTNLEVRGGGRVNIDATNGPVEIWVIDDFIMNSNAQIASTDFLARNVRINLVSDNVINPEVKVDLDEIDFESNSKIYGTIYAPNAQVTIDSNFELFGSMIARKVDLNSDCFIHFDEDLLNSTASIVPKFEVLCWREVPIDS